MSNEGGFYLNMGHFQAKSQNAMSNEGGFYLNMGHFQALFCWIQSAI